MGGVYLDLSEIILKPIESLVSDGYAVITREGNPGLFVQWLLIYPPNHRVLGICIEKCVQNIMTNQRIDVTELTGPFVYSQSLNEYFNQPNLYWISDQIINSNEQSTKVRLFGIDYNGFAHYLHPLRHLLYHNRLTWREEQKIKFGI